MARFTDTTSLFNDAKFIDSAPLTNPEAEKPPLPAKLGLIAQVTTMWTKAAQRRHLRLSIERLGELSDHLLQDAGLSDFSGTNATLDRDR